MTKQHWKNLLEILSVMLFKIIYLLLFILKIKFIFRKYFRNLLLIFRNSLRFIIDNQESKLK